MPLSRWTTIGALSDSFAVERFSLPEADDLSGTTFTIYPTEGKAIEFWLEKPIISWKDPDTKRTKTATYRATSIRDGIYFIDFMNGTCSISIILNAPQETFTLVIGKLPSKKDCQANLYHRALLRQELTAVKVKFIHGSLDKPYQNSQYTHHLTTELLGLRNLYRYSPNEAYEHIYLNKNFYTWHCVKGIEAGLADTERCHYYKIADELYLFVWRERIIPNLGVMLIDLKQNKSNGKICGYEIGGFNKVINFPITSYCSFINRTEIKI